MATKPYKPQESESQQVSEPATVYQRTLPGEQSTLRDEDNLSASSHVYQVNDAERTSIMRAKEQYARGEYYTQEEMDQIVAEWLS